MRSSIKRSLSGLLIAGALAFSVVGADARGGGSANGADAFIGIVGGNSQTFESRGEYGPQEGVYPGGGYQANTGHQFGHPYRNGQGGYGGSNGGYYRGY